MDEIESIILNISSKEKILEKEMLEIFDILKYHYHVENYVNNVCIINISNNSLAYYSKESKTIYINYNIMLYKITDIIKKIKSDNNIIFLNIFITKILIHEINHAFQQLIVDNYNNIESQIIYNANLVEQILKNKGLYNETIYNINPLERNAEFYALDTINNFSILILEEKVKQYFLSKQFQLSVNGYKNDINIFPAKLYFDKLSIYKSFSNLLSELNGENINYEKRISLGLKISENEYKILFEKKKLK